MITIDKENLKTLINTLKGVAPANYPSMDRLVASVNYLEALLATPEPKEETEDG